MSVTAKRKTPVAAEPDPVPVAVPAGAPPSIPATAPVMHGTRKAILGAIVLLDDIVTGIGNVMDRAKIGRKVMLYMTLWLTWRSYEWAVVYANSHPDKSGVELGLTIGAVLLPISLLQKAVFESYLSSTQSLTSDAPAAPGATVTTTAKSLTVATTPAGG